MNQKIKTEWVNALRGGEYKQGYHRLKTIKDNGTVEYCCLGVLCDLHSKATGNQWDGEYYGLINEDFVLPPEVQAWAGLESYDPQLGKEKCTFLNDGVYKKFDYIADLIEEHL